MKLIIGVLVVLAIALAGFIGFVVVDADKYDEYDNAGGGVAATAGPRVSTISTGQQVNFADHVEPGVITVFDFTADW